jgi:tripartite-type tricarboxylate transporter receptor subunit TctC
VQTALADPDLKAQMVAQGANTLPGSRADFISFLERDIASTARIVEKAKITVE